MYMVYRYTTTNVSDGIWSASTSPVKPQVERKEGVTRGQPCDQDRNMNNHQEFHQIFHQVNEHNKPQSAVVEGPDGGLMYAAV